MNSVKSCTDRLAALGKPMDDEDIIAKILNGLDYTTYKSIIDTVNGRDKTISFEELHEKLLNFELTYKADPPTDPVFPASVNAVYRNNNQRSPRTTYPAAPARFSPSSSTASPSLKPLYGKCQYCNVQGHVIAFCPEFTRLYPTVTFPHRAPRPRNPPQAYPAHISPSSSTAGRWLVDSGASHHITNDLANLSLHAPYDGSDELIIGDGSALPITHIGTSDGPNPPPRHA